MRIESSLPGSNAILIQKSDFYQAIFDSFPDLFVGELRLDLAFWSLLFPLKIRSADS
jgi:hypothetical protein